MRVNIDDIEDTYEGVLHGGQPFTGEMVEDSVEGWPLSSNYYFMGVPDGPYREWHGPNSLAKEGEMKDGRPVRTHREWYENGKMAVEREFDDHGDLQRVRRWNESGELTSDKITAR